MLNLGHIRDQKRIDALCNDWDHLNSLVNFKVQLILY